MKHYFFTVTEGESTKYIAFDMEYYIPHATDCPSRNVFMWSGRKDIVEEFLFDMHRVLMSDGNYDFPHAIRRVAGICNTKKSATITITLNCIENCHKLEKVKSYEIHMEEYEDGREPLFSLVEHHH